MLHVSVSLAPFMAQANPLHTTTTTTRDPREFEAFADHLTSTLDQIVVQTNNQAGKEALGLAGLGIVPGKVVWHLHVDCVCLGVGGAVLPALSVGIGE